MHKETGPKDQAFWLTPSREITWLSRRRDATKINVPCPALHFTPLIYHSGIHTRKTCRYQIQKLVKSSPHILGPQSQTTRTS